MATHLCALGLFVAFDVRLGLPSTLFLTMLSTLRTTTARSVGGSSLRAVGVAPTLARGHAGCSGHHHPPPPEATTKPAAAEKRELPHRSSGTPLNVPTTQGGPSDADAYCASLVQRLDPDAWLQSYFWPRREKAWWLAIRAFNVSTTWTALSVAEHDSRKHSFRSRGI